MSRNSLKGEDLGFGDEDDDSGPAPGNGWLQNSNARARVVSDVREHSRIYSGEALEALADVMRSAKDSKARVAAANSLLDRAWGRPAEKLEHTGADGAPIQTQRLDVSKLAPDELRLMTELMLKARAEVS